MYLNLHVHVRMPAWRVNICHFKDCIPLKSILWVQLTVIILFRRIQSIPEYSLSTHDSLNPQWQVIGIRSYEFSQEIVSIKKKYTRRGICALYKSQNLNTTCCLVRTQHYIHTFTAHYLHSCKPLPLATPPQSVVDSGSSIRAHGGSCGVKSGLLIGREPVKNWKIFLVRRAALLYIPMNSMTSNWKDI